MISHQHLCLNRPTPQSKENHQQSHLPHSNHNDRPPQTARQLMGPMNSNLSSMINSNDHRKSRIAMNNLRKANSLPAGNDTTVRLQLVSAISQSTSYKQKSLALSVVARRTLLSTLMSM